MTGSINGRHAELAEAAGFERDRRAEAYPAKIRASGLSAEAASIDFQCWVAIAEWLETGRFFSFAGGADPQHADAPIISWPALETAAASGLAAIEASTSAEEAKFAPDSDRLVTLYDRRASLVAIHRAVQLRRQSIDSANAELRQRAANREQAA